MTTAPSMPMDAIFPAKVVCGVLHHPEVDLVALESQLEAKWGTIQHRSPSYPFSEGSQYYCHETGEEHHRYFLSFQDLVHPEKLSEHKRWAMEMETWAKTQWPHSPRPINLDSGLIQRGRFVLATTKDFAHRIYCARGIYAEVTATLHKREVKSLPWTYPDIAQHHYDTFLLRCHQSLIEDAREHQGFPPFG